MSDDELPPGYTWEYFQAEAEKTNAWRAEVARKGIPFPGDDVDAEYLAALKWEELRAEAVEEARWNALTPAEQEATKALESVAEEETVEACEIITAAARRRFGKVVPSRKLQAALLPTDPDYGMVTTAFQRLGQISAMQGWP